MGQLGQSWVHLQHFTTGIERRLDELEGLGGGGKRGGGGEDAANGRTESWFACMTRVAQVAYCDQDLDYKVLYGSNTQTTIATSSNDQGPNTLMIVSPRFTNRSQDGYYSSE